MVATSLLGLSAGALYSGMLLGSGILQGARENLRANQILIEKMETIRLYTYTQITTPGFIPSTFSAPYEPGSSTNSASTGLTYSGTTVITNIPASPSYADDVRLVIVSVNWTSGNLQHTREMRTWVARNGLQTYIY